MSEMLTENFSAAEFKCRCGKCDGGKMDPFFMVLLQGVRTAMSQRMSINSGFRCAAHNATLKHGVPKSWHLVGKAADINVGTSEYRYHLVNTALLAGFAGIGIGKDFVHLDVGDKNKLWIY